MQKHPISGYIWPFFALLVCIQMEYRCVLTTRKAAFYRNGSQFSNLQPWSSTDCLFYRCLQDFMRIALQDDKFTIAAALLNQSLDPSPSVPSPWSLVPNP